MEIIEGKDNEKTPSGTISISDETDELNTTKDSVGSESVLEISRESPELQKDKHNDSTETEPAVDNSMVMEEENDEDSNVKDQEADEGSSNQTTLNESNEKEKH